MRAWRARLASATAGAHATPRMRPIVSRTGMVSKHALRTPRSCATLTRSHDLHEGRARGSAPRDRVDDRQVREGAAEAETGNFAAHAAGAPDQGAAGRVG